MHRKCLGLFGLPYRTAARFGISRLGVFAAAFALGLGATAVRAAPCYDAQQALPAQVIGAFLDNPKDLLQQFPDGGAQLISRIRDLVASDPTTLQPVLDLLANATKHQKSAIGAALAQAARICVSGNQAFATEIQEAIARTKDHDVVLAFTSTSGDQPTGAVGGGVAGGGIGGQIDPLPGGPNGTGPAERIGNDPTPTPLFSYTSSVSGVSGTSGTNTSSTINTISSPVSQ